MSLLTNLVFTRLGAAKWEQDYAACGGRRQSPINIPFQLEHRTFDDFVMTGYDNMKTYGLELINNGHTGTGLFLAN